MGDISKHISRHEMECNCGCGFSACDKELVEVVEDCLAYFESLAGERLYLTVTGPNRCIDYNRAILSAAKNSMHTKGLAMDFKISRVHPEDVANYLEQKYPTKYGIGRYIGRTHLDVRPGEPKRWDKK